MDAKKEITNRIAINQTSIDLACNDFVQPLLDGNVSPLEFAVQIESMKKIIEQVEKKSKSIITEHLYKSYHKDERISHRGCEIVRMVAGVRYDYSNCGDEYYNQLKREADELREKMKEREEFLQAIPQGKHETVVNEDTGEVMRIYAPAKSGTETYKIKFPKI